MAIIQVNAREDQCPVPVVKTKKAIENNTNGDEIEVIVGNTASNENVLKLFKKMNYSAASKKESNDLYIIKASPNAKNEESNTKNKDSKNIVVIFGDNKLGTGDEVLGKNLMKAFIYSLTQEEVLPTTMIFFNSGAFLTTEGSESISDIKALESKGVEILTCGTCLDFYHIKEKLLVGEVTNMYTIAEKMLNADSVIK